MEELDWSAERQVLIPAEHLWCDFKYKPCAKNISYMSNTNDLYIHYMDKSTGTPPSLEEKRALPNCGNKDGNIILKFKILFPLLLHQFWSIWNDCIPYVIGVWWYIFGSRSVFKVTPYIQYSVYIHSRILPIRRIRKLHRAPETPGYVYIYIYIFILGECLCII